MTGAGQPQPRAGAPRRLIGLVALLLFLGMVILLQWRIAPLSPGRFLPQAAFTGYSTADLWAFAQGVGQDPNAVSLYTSLLGWVDPAFIVLFSLWVALTLRPRMLGIVAAVVFALLDMSENIGLLYTLMSFRWDYIFLEFKDMPVPVVSGDMTFLSLLTSAKLTLATLLVAVIAVQAIAGRKAKT
ncbi:hypothetical protein VK792_03405 [Mesobacterium sp. TK19101]|uniref:Uncharacterized protein n=1 Tax=Mesobacterium hydrothermale TaxID=3111907 RepID=A0ABU6HF60_9RHOB|nr:hypothetical protein [Mesobacterium sp. TK19101]MEC3860319.1 hypothetical protein [Mesobacterium sp. TK19101]